MIRSEGTHAKLFVARYLLYYLDVWAFSCGSLHFSFYSPTAARKLGLSMQTIILRLVQREYLYS